MAARARRTSAGVFRPARWATRCWPGSEPARLLRPHDLRAEVGHHLARVEGARVAGRLGAVPHRDLGAGLVAVDPLHVVAAPERTAPEGIPVVPAEAAVEAPVRGPVGAPGPADRIDEGRPPVLGVPLHHLEPVEAP